MPDTVPRTAGRDPEVFLTATAIATDSAKDRLVKFAIAGGGIGGMRQLAPFFVRRDLAELAAHQEVFRTAR